MSSKSKEIISTFIATYEVVSFFILILKERTYRYSSQIFASVHIIGFAILDCMFISNANFPSIS